MEDMQKQCVCVCGCHRRQEAGWGAVISSVQMRACHRLQDAALFLAKDGVHVMKGIMDTLFPVPVFKEGNMGFQFVCHFFNI